MEDYTIRDCDLCKETRHVYKHGTSRWCCICIDEEQRMRIKDDKRRTQEKNKEI